MLSDLFFIMSNVVMKNVMMVEQMGDGSGRVIPMPPYSLSPHDIKTFGVRAKPFYLPTK
jgi:hypothetical protein